MKIVVNTISTKKISGGAYQIAINFLLATLRYPQKDIDWYYITSFDVNEVVGEQFIHLSGIRYFVFPTQPDFKGSYFKVKKELKKWEEEYKPDIIYTISSPCYFTFKTREVMRFANAWVTNTNQYAWESLPFKDKIRMYLYCINQRRMLKKARYIITQSNTVKQGLHNVTHLPENNIGVVSNVLPEIFHESKTNKTESGSWINIACVAAPVPHKNLEIIPDVLLELKNKWGIKNVCFHVTIPINNPIWERICKKMSANIIDTSCINNHGRCSQKELASIYNNCQFSFIPSLLETFSATSLEAMYFELPIVASDLDFNHDVICDAGLYFKPMNAVSAAERFVALFDSEDLCFQLKNKMSKQIELYNSYENHFTKIINYIHIFAKDE